MGSSSVPYKSKRLVTKKELEKKVFQQGSRGVSVYAIVAVVYFDSNNSPYHTGKGYIGVTPMGTYNKGRNSDDLGWLDDKRKIAYEVNFGEWLENYIRQDSTLPELKGQRSKNIELEVNRAWKGFSFLGGHKPLTKKKRLDILDDFHKTIHGYGLKYLIQEDSLWLSEEDEKIFISNKKGSLGKKILDFIATLDEEEQGEVREQIYQWVELYSVNTSMTADPKSIIKSIYNLYEKQAEEISTMYSKNESNYDGELVDVSLVFHSQGIKGRNWLFEEFSHILLDENTYNIREVLPAFSFETGWEEQMIEEFNNYFALHGFELNADV